MATVGMTSAGCYAGDERRARCVGAQVAESHHARNLTGWLDRSWNKAQQFVADNPPEDTLATVQVTILQAEQAVVAAGYRKKVRPVLGAHAAAAYQAGNMVHSQPRREAAVEAGVSLRTVDAHRDMLIAEGSW